MPSCSSAALELRAPSARARGPGHKSTPFDLRVAATQARPGNVRRARARRCANRPVAGATPFEPLHSASRPSQSSARSGQPAGEGAACGRWPSGLAHRPSAVAGRPPRRFTPSERARALGRRTPPASSARRLGSRPRAGDQLMARPRRAGRRCQRAATGRPARRRRLVGDKWRASGGDELRDCRRVARQVGEHGAQRLRSFAVAAAEHRLIAPARRSGVEGRRGVRRAAAMRQPVSTAAKARRLAVVRPAGHQAAVHP